MNTIHKQVFTTVIAAHGAEPSITISTDTVDRDNDVLLPEGCDSRSYLRNPVVLFGHDHRELPVGASTSITVGHGGINARWKWLERDERAARVRNAFEQGVLRAASVGFQPLEWEPRDGGRGLTYTKWALLEWSLVPIPANPDAVRVLRSLRLDEEPVLELLDDDQVVTFDEQDLAAALRAVVPNAVRQAIRGQHLDPARLAGMVESRFVEPKFDVDTDLVRRLVAECITDAVRTVARDAAQQAINHVRGRLD